MKTPQMPVAKLAQALAKLPEGCTVEGNSLGNLIVSDSDDEVIGYIDFRAGGFVPVDE